MAASAGLSPGVGTQGGHRTQQAPARVVSADDDAEHQKHQQRGAERPGVVAGHIRRGGAQAHAGDAVGHAVTVALPQATRQTIVHAGQQPVIQGREGAMVEAAVVLQPVTGGGAADHGPVFPRPAQSQRQHTGESHQHDAVQPMRQQGKDVEQPQADEQGKDGQHGPGQRPNFFKENHGPRQRQQQAVAQTQSGVRPAGCRRRNIQHAAGSFHPTSGRFT